MSISPNYFTSDAECRICFENESTRENPLISPCLCRGTSKYVHKNCIQRWREVNNNTEYFWKCRECNHDYNLIKSYPKENFIIPETNISELRTTRVFSVFYFIAFFTGFFLRIFDKTLNYPLLNLLTNFKKPSSKLITFIRTEELYNIQYYFSVNILVISILSYISFLIQTIIKLQRFFTYWNKMCIPFILALGSSIHLYYFGLITDQDIKGIESTFSIETFFSFTNLGIYSLILKLHNNIIINMNKNNAGDIRNIETLV